MTVVVVIDVFVNPRATNENPGEPGLIQHELEIIELEPGEEPSLGLLQEKVGGYIESVRIQAGGTIQLPTGDGASILGVKEMFVNEEGRLLQLPINQVGSIISGCAGGPSLLVGPVVVIADELVIITGDDC